MRELLNTAWRLLALNPATVDDPHPHQAWPAIRHQHVPADSDTPAHCVWQIASAGDARRMLDLLAQVARRWHLYTIHETRRTRTWEPYTPAPLHRLTRHIATLAGLNDNEAHALVSAHVPILLADKGPVARQLGSCQSACCLWISLGERR
jgi:hypothetical protein